MTRLLGRFFEWLATINKLQSFFFDKNSSESTASNGRISFFLESDLKKGFFKRAYGS